MLLQREERYLKRLQAEAETVQLMEDAWASSDPYTSQGASVAGLGSAANDLFHPGAIGRHSARPGSRQHGALPPYYYTEMQHWHLVDAARTVEAFCPTAVCILDVLTQFAIFTGFSYSVVERKKPGKKPPPQSPGPTPDGQPPGPVPIETNPLADAATEWLDRWRDKNDWVAWETEIFRRTRRDGEAFCILEPDDDEGWLRLRSVEPEQVKEPTDWTKLRIPADHTFRFGILTRKKDTSVPLGYWVISQYNDAANIGEFYEADEVFHLKTEWVDRQTKRGVSDFFSVANDLPGVKKLLRNLREGSTVQASIAWIREHPEGMDPVGLGSNAPPVTTRSGQTSAVRYMDGPEILDVSRGMTYTAGPLGIAGKNDALIQVLQAALRNIGARWQMPEGLVSGDASNANLASALVAEAPFVHAMEARQWWYRNAFKRLLERVIDHAAMAGLIDGGARENILDEIEVSVEMPPVIPRKALEETQKNKILNDSGVLSTQDWTAREDLDFDDQQAKFKAHPLVIPMIGFMGPGGEEAADDSGKQGNPEPEREGVSQ